MSATGKGEPASRFLWRVSRARGERDFDDMVCGEYVVGREFLSKAQCSVTKTIQSVFDDVYLDVRNGADF